MNIESLLEQIEEILDSGTKIAMTHKCAVNADAIKTCIEDIRLNMPEEISQAKAIVADRSAILSKAKNDAVSSVTKAQDKAHELMANTEAKTEQMLSAARDLDFERAAKLRDQLLEMRGEAPRKNEVQKKRRRTRESTRHH